MRGSKYLDHCYQPRLCLLSAYAWDTWHQVPSSSDLSHLVTEIRALRGQLEQSIQVNTCLRRQLEQQLDGGGKAGLGPDSGGHGFAASTDPGSRQPPFPGRKAKGIGKPSAGREGARASGGRESLAPSMLLGVRGEVGGEVTVGVRAWGSGPDLPLTGGLPGACKLPCLLFLEHVNPYLGRIC